MKAPLTVAVIIPFHQENEVFKLSLTSILESKESLNEIILVNDGESDNSNLIKLDPLIKMMKTEGRKGPAYARNLGAKYAKSDILCFIDSDITVPKDLFERIIKEFQENLRISALFGSYDDLPGDNGFLSQYRNLLHHYVHQTSNEEAFTFWTGCGAIKREIFLELNGFDESLYKNPEIEDIELGYRLKAANHQIRLVKNLQVKHLKKWTPRSLIHADLFCRAIPWTQLLLAKKNTPNDLNLKIKDKISVTLSFLIILFLFATFWKIIFSLGLFACSFLLFFLNFLLYKFFYQKRGLFFMLKVLPWHWLFYFLSGMGFCIGLITHANNNIKKNSFKA